MDQQQPTAQSGAPQQTGPHIAQQEGRPAAVAEAQQSLCLLPAQRSLPVQLGGGAGSLQGYLVDNSGNINVPVVGKLHVAGLTKGQCEDLIREKISPYLSATENPIVTVRMASYRVTVIGEVSSPGVVQVPTEKMSVVEALAQSGDLTIYGRRDNVMLIREDASGQKQIHRLNLNDANLLNSPYYYVQQNDVIYVQPNSVKAKNSGIGSSTTIWFSFISIATSLTSLLVNILRN